MSMEDCYANEEQSIIDNETLTEAERKRALRDLYREGCEELSQ